MTGFTKLFASILDSTVWLESDQVRLVWITMLAMADRDGIIESSVPGLAKRAAVGREHVEKAIGIFSTPDADSRSQEHDGRRIEVIDGGWRLLNHDKYRERASADDAREKAAERKRKQRERQAQKAAAVTLKRDMSRPVTLGHAPSRPVPPGHAIAEAESETECRERHAAPADGLSTETSRWAAWLRWRDEAGKLIDEPGHRPKLELAWSATEKELARKLGSEPPAAFEAICRAYLAWPDGKPLPGGKAALRGDRPASWLPTGVYQIVEHLLADRAPSAAEEIREEAKRRAANDRASQPTNGQARRA